MNKLKNIKIKVGTTLFVLIAVFASSVGLYAVTNTITKDVQVDELKGCSFEKSTKTFYTSDFKPNASIQIAPWVQYDYVVYEGYYYLYDRYKQYLSYVALPANKYYASKAADGRVTTTNIVKDTNNQICMRGTTDLQMVIKYLRFTYPMTDL